MAKKKEKANLVSINLEEATATFRISAELGAVTRQTYDGVFTVRTLLEPFRKLASGRTQRALLGSMAQHATDHEHNIAFALAELQQRVLSAPPWWDSMPDLEVRGSAVRDENIILMVLDSAIEAQAQYSKDLHKSSAEAIKALKKKIDVLSEVEDERK